MASIVIASVDQCLALGMTYLYQIMPTLTKLMVEALLAKLISARQDNRTRSSQVVIVSRSQITRCLDSASDNY